MATHPHHNMSNLKQVILLGKIFFFYTNIVKESILLSNMPGKIMLPVNRVLGCSKTQEGLRLPSGYMTAGKCRAMTVRGMQEQIQEPSPVAELPSSLPLFFQMLKVTGRTSEGPLNCSLLSHSTSRPQQREGEHTAGCSVVCCRKYHWPLYLEHLQAILPLCTALMQSLSHRPLPRHSSFLADPNSSFSLACCFPSPPSWRPKHPELFLGSPHSLSIVVLAWQVPSWIAWGISRIILWGN